MKKVIARCLAGAGAVAALTVPTVLTAGPAAAETCFPGTSACQGGRVVHLNDTGYDPGIIIFCNYADGFTNGVSDPDWTKEKIVQEGTSSNADCGDDTDVIYIRVGEELHCQVESGAGNDFEKVFDATGSHKIGDLWERSCVLQED